jgi:acetyl esterase/lipase
MSNLSRRELLVGSGCAASASSVLPPRARAASLAPTSPGIDPLSLVDPGLLATVKSMRKGDFEMSAKNLAQVRNSSVPASPTRATTCEERAVPVAKGAPDVRVFVINAVANERKRPAILHIHGGGFVAGTTAEGIPALQQVAVDHDCVIVTVDYRLAPETRFPGSLEDNYAALKWLYSSAGSLGVDASRIAVMGLSAGGGHAAMLTIAARDRGEVPIAFQLLSYPMLDDRTGSSRSVAPYIGAYIWSPASNRFGWSSLLGVPAGSRIVPAGAVPARVENLTGLPPAFIGVGSIDLLVDEDVGYASRLIDSGVSVQLCVVPGAYHGFDLFAPDAPVSKAYRATCNAALVRAFGSTAKS